MSPFLFLCHTTVTDGCSSQSLYVVVISSTQSVSLQASERGNEDVPFPSSSDDHDLAVHVHPFLCNACLHPSLPLTPLNSNVCMYVMPHNKSTYPHSIIAFLSYAVYRPPYFKPDFLSITTLASCFIPLIITCATASSLCSRWCF
jgi:hypothetical protein